MLEALHAGPFAQIGRGRAAVWCIAPIGPEVERYRLEVWKARRRGIIDAVEAFELLLDPKPQVLEMLAEVAV